MEKDKIFYTLMVLTFTTIGYGLVFAHNKKVIKLLQIIAAILIFIMAMIEIWF